MAEVPGDQLFMELHIIIEDSKWSSEWRSSKELAYHEPVKADHARDGPFSPPYYRVITLYFKMQSTQDSDAWNWTITLAEPESRSQAEEEGTCLVSLMSWLW